MSKNNDRDMGKAMEEEFREEGEKIKFLESLLKALYKKNIVTDKDGKQTVKFSPAELREMIESEAQIIKMKRRARKFPKEWW